MAYPTSLDNFAHKIDNFDTIFAQDVNELQDAIEAIEGELGTLPKGPAASVKALLESLMSGWIPEAETWVYVSATSFKIVGKNVVSRFPPGTRIRLTQSSTVKYFVVKSVAFSTDTTVTITAGSDYSLANAAITEPSYSQFFAPANFPGGFNYTPTWTATTTNPTLGNGTIYGRWTRLGSIITVSIILTFGSTTNFGAGNYYLGLPFSARNANNVQFFGIANIRDSGVASYERIAMIAPSLSVDDITLFVDPHPGTNNNFATPTSPFSFGSGDVIAVQITYESV